MAATKKEIAVKATGNSGKSSGKVRGRIENLTPFQPGQSGNPSGRPKKIITGAIEAELAKVVKGDKEGRTWLQAMVQGAIREAVKGDIKAFQEITDRVEGKSMQGVELSTPNGIQISDMTPEQMQKRIAELLAKGRSK